MISEKRLQSITLKKTQSNTHPHTHLEQDHVRHKVGGRCTVCVNSVSTFDLTPKPLSLQSSHASSLQKIAVESLCYTKAAWRRHILLIYFPCQPYCFYRVFVSDILQ